MNIWISILLITLCALCWDVGVVWQKQAADALPRMELNREFLKTLWAFVSSGKWMGGMIVSGAGWGLFAWALDSTPISLARTIQGSGFVILAFFSIFFLNHRLKPIEWLGVVVVTAGVVALGLSEPAENQTTSVLHLSRLGIAIGAGGGVCLAVFALRKVFNLGFSWVVVFSIFAGTLLGIGDVLTKAVLVATHDQAYVLAFAVMGPALVVSYLTGFLLLTRGYQHGRAILVTGVSDFCARLATIFIGVYAMGESFPTEALYRDLRIGGMVAILSGTALLARFSGEQLAEEMSGSE